MKVDLNKRGDGRWQADIITPDGKDHHAIGHNPGAALVELGMYLQTLKPPSDLEQLARVVVDPQTQYDRQLRKAMARADLELLQSRAWPEAEFNNMVESLLLRYQFKSLPDLKLWATSE